MHTLRVFQPNATPELVRCLASSAAFPAFKTLVVSGQAKYQPDPPPGDAIGRLCVRLDPATRRINLLSFGAFDLTLIPAESGYRIGFQSAAVAEVWPAGAETLDWSGVTEVRLRGVPITPDWFATLAACFPDGLAALELANCGLQFPHAEALAVVLPILRPNRLDLSANPLTSASLEPIVASCPVKL